MHAAPYDPGLLPVLLEFASRSAASRPDAVYLMPSDICWRGPEADDVRLWFDDAGLAGYAWFEPPTGVEMDLRHDLSWDADIATAMLDWADERRRAFPAAYPWLVDLESMEQWADAVLDPGTRVSREGRWLTAVAFEADGPRIAALEARGYTPTQHFAPDYRLNLRGELPEHELPAGFRVRHVEDTPADLEERTATHRDAWVGSTWNVARYRALRATPAYDPELDVVVETQDGTFANCCIAWADPISGVGSFEPVGTRPAWRGKGVTRALIVEAFRRLRAKGMNTARVGTAGFNTPAQSLYEGCGFQRTGTMRTFMRRLE